MNISFVLNGSDVSLDTDPLRRLVDVLRDEFNLTGVKEGCGEGECGACSVLVNDKITYSCILPVGAVEGSRVLTIEGFRKTERYRVLQEAFTEAGSVQCGFCSPGFVARAKILLEGNPKPTRKDIVHALRFNVCRCTGYVNVVEAIRLAAEALRENREIRPEKRAGVGEPQPRYDAYERAVGRSPFVDDLRFENMLYGALKFSDHPRAVVKRIDSSRAEKLPGVVKVFTAEDIPGERITGLIVKDLLQALLLLSRMPRKSGQSSAIIARIMSGTGGSTAGSGGARTAESASRFWIVECVVTGSLGEQAKVPRER